MGSDSKEESYVIVDIGSSLTKAVLVERTDGGYGLVGEGEAPTTVDPPELDVTIGVERALRCLGRGPVEELLGLGEPSRARRLLCSSSASGLYMMVAGVINMISAESAQRAALGAGALLMDVFSSDDPRPEFEMVRRMRALRPDMFLLAGGTDGGAEKQVLEMAGLIDEADIRPRFGSEYKLPVIYAGNVQVREGVSKALSEERYATRDVDNVRPIVEVENLGPAREGIYDSYMEHVIIHSPGYEKLVGWVEGDIIPTQAAIGNILYAYAQERGVNLLAVDIGGATTDIYSVYGGVFNRSLDADVGMTYGISNVMKKAGVQNIMRWIPEQMGEKEVRNTVGNVMVLQPEAPTPQEAMVQGAAAREAIRLGLEQHRNVATRLRGVSLRRTIADIFDQALEASIMDLMNTHVVIGRGRIFSEGRPGGDSALLLLDAVQPGGVTEVLVDGSGTLPHLGMLLERNREAALQIASKECLQRLGTCVAAHGRAQRGEEAMRLRMTTPDGAVVEEAVAFGELKAIPLGADESARVEVTPANRLDVGRGRGRTLEAEVKGGEEGLILDARGRPLEIPKDKKALAAWAEALKRGRAAPIPASQEG